MCMRVCVVVAFARRRTRNWRLFFSLSLSHCVLVFGLYAITNSTYAHALVMHDQLNVYRGVCGVVWSGGGGEGAGSEQSGFSRGSWLGLGSTCL